MSIYCLKLSGKKIKENWYGRKKVQIGNPI